MRAHPNYDRYPRGESYFDLIARVDPLVHELESYQEPVLIVSHQVHIPPVSLRPAKASA